MPAISVPGGGGRQAAEFHRGHGYVDQGPGGEVVEVVVRPRRWSRTRPASRPPRAGGSARSRRTGSACCTPWPWRRARRRCAGSPGSARRTGAGARTAAARRSAPAGRWGGCRSRPNRCSQCGAVGACGRASQFHGGYYTVVKANLNRCSKKNYLSGFTRKHAVHKRGPQMRATRRCATPPRACTAGAARVPRSSGSRTAR